MVESAASETPKMTKTKPEAPATELNKETAQADVKSQITTSSTSGVTKDSDANEETKDTLAASLKAE